MSIKVMTMVFDSTLEPNPRLVMLCLADRADDDGTSAYPSKARIAAKSGLSERTVQRILGELREIGLIQVTADADPVHFRPTVYAINLPRLREIEGETPCPPSRKTKGEGETLDTPQGETGATRGGDTVTGGGRQAVSPYSSCDSSCDSSIQTSLLPSVGDRAHEDRAILISAGIEVKAPIPKSVPVAVMVGAYHRLIPSGKSVKVISVKTMTALKRVWSDLGKSEDAWIAFCQQVEASDWLAGRSMDREGKPFSCLDLDWIIGTKYFDIIRGGRYDNKQASGPGARPTPGQPGREMWPGLV